MPKYGDWLGETDWDAAEPARPVHPQCAECGAKWDPDNDHSPIVYFFHNYDANLCRPCKEKLDGIVAAGAAEDQGRAFAAPDPPPRRSSPVEGPSADAPAPPKALRTGPARRSAAATATQATQALTKAGSSLIIVDQMLIKPKLVGNRLILKVSSPSGNTYTVQSQGANQVMTCDCPHFLFRLVGTGQICKHIKAAQDGAQIIQERLEGV